MSKGILIFDSGVGGLSIMEHIQHYCPTRPIFYLCDNARMPYGELSDREIISGVCELVTKAVAKFEIEIVVIACNSASTVVLPQLRKLVSQPVVGVIPAIKPAAALSKNKSIALLATPATVQTDYTKALSKEFASDCMVTLIGTSELVQMAEEKLRGKAINQAKLENILAPITDSNIDVVVLGCTHFPIVANEIKSICGKEVTLIDSGDAIGRRVQNLLAEVPTLEARGEMRAWHTAKADAILNQNLKKLGFSTIEQF